jgi:ABC-type lipoprotein release transport system permease subunit
VNLPFYIAKRYFIAKKSSNAVNLIAAISMLGVMVGTAAMIAVLSGFNGLESLIRSFYDTFDPDIKIEAVEGKFLPADTSNYAFLADWPEVESYSRVLEDKALIQFHDKEFIATIKGVDQNYGSVTRFEETLNRGEYFGDMQENVGVVGIGVAYHLNLLRLDFTEPLSLYVPRSDYKLSLDPSESVNSKVLYPMGIFSVQPDYDVKYVVTPLVFAQDLFAKGAILSAIELKLVPGADVAKIKEKLKATLGPAYKVRDRNEQQATIFRVIQVEGLATFLILSFILTIASFGILGSLIMLILEKRKDVHTLRSLGLSTQRIKRIFLNEGLLISSAGCLLGVLLGIGLVLAQDRFALISLGQGYAMDAYPVELKFWDVLRVFLTVMAIGSVVSWLAVRRLKTDF